MTTHLLSRTGLRPRRAGFGARLTDALAVWRQRRALANLDDDRLADIGLSRTEAEAEASRPIWDVPAHWRN